MADHPGFDTLAAWWLAELPGDDALEEHLLACAHCTAHLEWLAALSDGVRASVRAGRVGLFVSRRFADELVQAGLRLREYNLDPGGSVNCTIRADDDAVLSHIRAPLAGVKRVDALRRITVGGVEQPEERISDVPFDLAAGELLFIPTPARLKKMPSYTTHLRLVAVDEAGERALGEYTFRHSAG